MLKQKEISVAAKSGPNSGFVLAKCEGLSERMRERLEDYIFSLHAINEVSKAIYLG